MPTQLEQKPDTPTQTRTEEGEQVRDEVSAALAGVNKRLVRIETRLVRYQMETMGRVADLQESIDSIRKHLGDRPEEDKSVGQK